MTTLAAVRSLEKVADLPFFLFLGGFGVGGVT